MECCSGIDVTGDGVGCGMLCRWSIFEVDGGVSEEDGGCVVD